jgi:DNA mismatch repair ATPase MutS
MKVFLMYKDRDFSLREALPWNSQDFTQDLELNTLLHAMALDDEFISQVATQALLSGLNNDPDTILYRQSVLKDCLRNPSVIRRMYDIAGPSIGRERRSFFSMIGEYSPNSILLGAIEMLRLFVTILKQLRKIAEEEADKFTSDGFSAFFAMLRQQLEDEYFAAIANHLNELKLRGGVLISAGLGRANKGDDYVLLKAPEQQSWMRRIFQKQTDEYTFFIHPEDQTGAGALSDLKKRGINSVANTLAQSAQHILNFLTTLATELAFYLGCLNLNGQLAEIGEPICFPVPSPSSERKHSFKGLYDVCLALSMKQKVVGNDLHADDKSLVIITGANQGGKSTFLRGIGLAQLMMQCGMFAPAESFGANVCDCVFTHYKRQEDINMESGKLDEELSRMSDIVDHITLNSLVLFNESFAATNEREGSEIARQIISVLLRKRIKVFFVTHLYEFANSFYRKETASAIFLRAERQADGARTFKLTEGEPLQTSYGEDLYNGIFATENGA